MASLQSEEWLKKSYNNLQYYSLCDFLSFCLEQTPGFASSKFTFCTSSKAFLHHYPNKKKSILTLTLKIKKSILTLTLKITSMKRQQDQIQAQYHLILPANAVWQSE